MMKRKVSGALSVIISLCMVIGVIPVSFAVNDIKLNATYGDLLSELSLPDGYDWNEENPETTFVGNTGENTFSVLHTTEEATTEESVVIVVAPAFISEVTLQTDGSQYYTGDPGEPEMQLSFKGEELIRDVDYTITYENVDSGIAKVTVEGIGNFQGKTSLIVNIEKQDVESISLNQNEIELNPGESCQLTATIAPATATFKDVVWSSTDEDVAIVDETGLVTAIGNGSATVVAESKDGALTAECAVSVITNATGITIPMGIVRMFYDETYQMKVIITPFDANNTDVIWTTADDSIVTVDENGMLKAVGRGDTTVTVTTVDGEYSDTCEVMVRYTWWQAIIWLFLGCIWYFR